MANDCSPIATGAICGSRRLQRLARDEEAELEVFGEHGRAEVLVLRDAEGARSYVAPDRFFIGGFEGDLEPQLGEFGLQAGRSETIGGGRVVELQTNAVEAANTALELGRLFRWFGDTKSPGRPTPLARITRRTKVLPDPNWKPPVASTTWEIEQLRISAAGGEQPVRICILDSGVTPDIEKELGHTFREVVVDRACASDRLGHGNVVSMVVEKIVRAAGSSDVSLHHRRVFCRRSCASEEEIVKRLPQPTDSFDVLILPWFVQADPKLLGPPLGKLAASGTQIFVGMENSTSDLDRCKRAQWLAHVGVPDLAAVGCVGPWDDWHYCRGRQRVAFGAPGYGVSVLFSLQFGTSVSCAVAGAFEAVRRSADSTVRRLVRPVAGFDANCASGGVIGL